MDFLDLWSILVHIITNLGGTMNFRYDIKHINGLRLIEFYSVNQQQDNTPLTLTYDQSQNVLKTKTRHEENALFYQLAKLIYEIDFINDDFDKDRLLYEKNNKKIQNKYLDLFLNNLVYVDFKGIFDIQNSIKKNSYNKIAKAIFLNGFIFTDIEGNETKFLPFNKSGSMSRSSTISFLNSNYKEEMKKRIDLGLFLENEKYNISKVLAYKGLYLSNGIRIELDNLNQNSVVVVNDYIRKDNLTRSNTVISRDTIYELIIEMFFNKSDDVFENKLAQIKGFCQSVSNSKISDYYKAKNDKDNYDNMKYIRNQCLDIVRKNPKTSKPLSKCDLSLYSLIEQVILDHYEMLELNTVQYDDEYKLIENVNVDFDTNMFDGQGFIDKSLMEYINQSYLNVNVLPYHYSAQFRLPFCKGMLHSINLKEWFSNVHTEWKNDEINAITDAFGIKRKVSDIKIILTVSQFKCFNWLKKISISQNFDKQKYNSDPMKYYFSLFNKYNHSLYFTNLDNPHDYSNNTVLNYQVLHTPSLSNFDFKKILKKSKTEYVDLLTDKNTQINYFLDNLHFEDSIGDIDKQRIKSEHHLLGLMLKKNSHLINEKLYQNRIENYSKALLKNIKLGRISIEGSVNYLCGDLLENIHQITYKLGIFGSGRELGSRFYLPNKHDSLDTDKNYSILRNPHITNKELATSKPVKAINNVLRKKYFGHLNNVLMIDAYTNKMLAMQTADTDGDMVRLIYNDIYNNAVKTSIDRNNNVILLFPDIKAIDNYIDDESIYETIKNTFSARVGLISNHAFTHSVHAYNENNTSDLVQKEKDRKSAEKLSCIVSAEIDSAKTGKAPRYNSKKVSDPYLKFIRLLKNNKKDNTKFKLSLESPNIYYLKNYAEETHKNIVVNKANIKASKKGYVKFQFEETKNWKSKLSKDLQHELSLLILSYNDWNQHATYLWNQERFKRSTIFDTILYIIELQYDDGTNEMLIESMVRKMSILGKETLNDTRNDLISNKWHYALDEEKDSLCEELLPDIFNQEEKNILFNFNCDGHKLFFLVISETISRLHNKDMKKLASYDSISRFKVLLENKFKHYGLDSTKIINDMINDMLFDDCTDEELIKSYIDKTPIKKKYEYKKVCNYIHKLNKKLKNYRKKIKNLDHQDLTVIFSHFSAMSKFLFDKANNLIESVIARQSIYDYCHQKIDNLFIKHNENTEEIVKYVYSLKKFDLSSKFLFTICKNNILINIKNYNKEGDQIAE